MIASRQHRFIFIKTKKTAGTSIELALGPHCGPDDILSPISARHDIERFEQSGVFPRHFASEEFEKRYRMLLSRRNPKALKMMLRRSVLGRLGAHATPLRIKARVGELWDNAFRFTVERHPYEKAVSLAAMRKRDLNWVVFNDTRYVGYPWYLEDGRLIVDRVIIYDRLSSDFNEVLTHLGLPGVDLPHARKAERDRTPAQEQLTASQRTFIYEQCAPEFELFGWER